MTEKEYMDLSDLVLLQAALDMLGMVNATKDPNEFRVRSIRSNLALCIKAIKKDNKEFIT